MITRLFALILLTLAAVQMAFWFLPKWVALVVSFFAILAWDQYGRWLNRHD